jgi:hypothetical protein
MTICTYTFRSGQFCGFCLRRLAAVVIEQSAQAFVALDLTSVFLMLKLWSYDFTVEALMVSFFMIMFKILVNSIA